MITIAILAFLSGYLIGKFGKLYFYVEGDLYSKAGAERYLVYMPEINGVGVELFGIDYTDGTLMPVYRPFLRFARGEGFRSMGIRVSDFHEVAILVSHRFPFIKARYRPVVQARSLNE